MPNKLYFATLLLLLSALFQLTAQTSTINYLPSTADFPNPERGFYYPTNSDGGALTSAFVAGLRTPYTPWQATYQVHSTLIFRYFMLTPFINSAISAGFLTQIENDLNAVRDGGAKVILRFSYTNTYTNMPPYGDATKTRVLQHIGQLAPVFEDHADIIAAVQMGFVGIWGEGYYTDHFGDANTVGSLNSTNWDDRKEVIDALLDALPASRMIQLRYVQQKQKFLYGNAASTDPALSAPLGAGQAFSGSDIARLGFHNDCFLASNTDAGTFVNYDPWSAAHADMVTDLRSYKSQDADYVVVGGETCSANQDISGDHECAADGGRADTDLALFNYSYLNADYNNAAVNNSWDGTCLDDIKKQLGYRFEMQSGTFTNSAQPGQSIQVDLSIENQGYAPPFNRRGIEFILRNIATSELYFASPNADPQQWAAGSTNNINETFCLPIDMPLGSYELLLHLPDPELSLYGNPDYSIRLANQLPLMTDVWEAATGYNKLGHILLVNNVASGSNCVGGQTTFTPFSALPVSWLSFELKETARGEVVCQWTTANESGNRGFWIERSTDGHSFQELGWVDAKEAGEAINDYQWTDAAVAANQKTYYRIKQVDWDGSTNYSPIKSIRLTDEEEPELVLYPNPVHDVLNIRALVSAPTQIDVFNASGIKVKTLDTNPGGDTRLDCRELPSGWYSLRFQNTNDFVIRRFLKL